MPFYSQKADAKKAPSDTDSLPAACMVSQICSFRDKSKYLLQAVLQSQHTSKK